MHSGCEQVKRLYQKGFTLIEMAVVIVIIGLLAGGIVAGQSLIHAAELRSVITDLEDFGTNITIFEQQYLALPGDMQNAEDYWPGTKAGNGDGFIDWDTSPKESFLAWQHLGLAGLAPGEFSGGGADANIGENVPASKLGGGYTLHDGAEVKELYNLTTPISVMKNYILLGNPGPSGKTDGPLLTPRDAQSIDDKMDDAKPDSGSVMARGEGCTKGSGDDIYYDISQEEPRCVLEFRLP